MSAKINKFEDLPPLRDVISEHGLAPKKSLGQNFLLDLNVTDKIVRCAQERYYQDWRTVNAVEIGPGPGGLTRSLLRSGLNSVTAIEFDKRAVAALEDLKEYSRGRLDVIECDALKCDVKEFTKVPRIIVANLPYNIATPLLINWLRDIREVPDSYSSMTLMFQKEVADRICALPNTKSYGRLSVMSQWLCDVEVVYNLPPSAFTPPPKVDSAVVHFKPRALDANAPSFDAVESVTAAAFGQRRKMIRSSLKPYQDAFEGLNIDGQRRAETLSVDEFIKLAGVRL